MIFTSALTWFFSRTVPTSRKAKPACMASTMMAPMRMKKTSLPAWKVARFSIVLPRCPRMEQRIPPRKQFSCRRIAAYKTITYNPVRTWGGRLMLHHGADGTEMGHGKRARRPAAAPRRCMPRPGRHRKRARSTAKDGQKKPAGGGPAGGAGNRAPGRRLGTSECYFTPCAFRFREPAHILLKSPLHPPWPPAIAHRGRRHPAPPDPCPWPGPVPRPPRRGPRSARWRRAGPARDPGPGGVPGSRR